MPGFEPGASTSRTWRAAKLRYIPFRGGSVPQAGRSADGDVGTAAGGQLEVCGAAAENWGVLAEGQLDQGHAAGALGPQQGDHVLDPDAQALANAR
jgi:hypothetical protein